MLNLVKCAWIIGADVLQLQLVTGAKRAKSSYLGSAAENYAKLE